MDKTIDKGILSELLLNTSVEISIYNFFVAILLSTILAYFVKYTYIKTSQSLSNKDYFSDIFVPLAIITCLVITVIKFSLALSLGLVGALSIVRFRAAIKEPEELVYLFFIIGIGLANGANQFIIAILTTLVIVTFLFARYWYQQKKSVGSKETSEINLVQIHIKKKSIGIEQIIQLLKPHSKYLRLKSAQIDKDREDYTFFIEFNNVEHMNNFLTSAKNFSEEDIQISLYTRLGVYE